MATAPGAGGLPPKDCALCPRLAAFREDNRSVHPAFFNAPVPSFGGLDARLLIVGLAPGLKGANRTGRPFTGDYAGDLLYQTLLCFGFAKGRYDKRPDDGLTLRDCRITNAVRCVPPENKPLGGEVRNCAPFLKGDIEAMPRLSIILTLGSVAHGAVLACLGLKKSAYRFAHGALHHLSESYLLANSYHCSRYNTNTGRLTEAMFHDVFADVRRHLDSS